LLTHKIKHDGAFYCVYTGYCLKKIRKQLGQGSPVCKWVGKIRKTRNSSDPAMQ